MEEILAWFFLVWVTCWFLLWRFMKNQGKRMEDEFWDAAKADVLKVGNSPQRKQLSIRLSYPPPLKVVHVGRGYGLVVYEN